LIPDREPEWDQLSIETPELVAIDMPVAGLGSRFIALLVDYLIWLAVIVLAVILLSVLDPSLSHFSKLGEKWEMAVFIFLPFIFRWGYFTLFEAFWNGRTPGKRVAKIRVIQRTGRGIGLFESMTRNFLRFVDEIPVVYMVGAVSIFLTRQHQRLGDLAAGTIVVHERERLDESSAASSHRSFTAGLFEQQVSPPIPAQRASLMDLPSSAIQRLGIADLEVLEGFFARRLDFTLETRAALAQRIVMSIHAKTGLAVPTGISTETFLEEVAHQLRDLVRIR
jgi:uncharacterized RDD family membrane protein YckC